MKLLLITIDDVGFDLLSSAPTPKLDSIRANGKNFSRFVTAPNCSNFRAKVDSGRYSPRPENLTGGLYDHQVTVSLPTGLHTLGSCSRSSAQIGKWHLCRHDDFGHRTAAGYPWFAGSQANLTGQSYYDWLAVENGKPAQTQAYATDYVASRAAERVVANHPFIGCHFNACHIPVEAPPGYTDATLENMLAYADDRIASVHDVAIANGYLVILCSDGGGTKADGGKGNLTTQALNAFLCLSGDWPQTRSCDSPVDATDIHATAWQIVRQGVHPLSDGIPLTLEREVAFADKFNQVGTPPGPKWEEMATDGALKLIRTPVDGAWTLTDWDDQPSGADPTRLLYALDQRLL